MVYGKYVYGIIIHSGDIALGTKGVGGAGLVYTIAHQDLSCVVSNYFGREFSSMSKEELAPRRLAHQAVVEQVMRHSVLPVKFGTVLANSEEVQRLLSQGYSQFFFALVWLQDKVEVKVLATGGWYRGNCRERIISSLQPLAIEVQPNPVVSNEMVMNLAFLVRRTNLEAFDSCLRQLNNLFGNQVNLRIIAPLPPYSFATVEVIKPSPEKIEEARQLLGLGEVISELEVRKAYCRLAAETNPDCRPAGKLARIRLTRLRRASDLLIAYCRGQAESGGSFLISIRRLRSDEVQPSHLVGIGT